MPKEDDIKEIVEDVSFAFTTAMRDGCFDILIVIRDHLKIIRTSLDTKDYPLALFHNNKIFWNIGICIANRLDKMPHNTSKIFDSISKKLLGFYRLEKHIAFEPENLKLCYKLSLLLEEDYFDYIASQLNWSHFVVLLTNCNDTNLFQKIAYRAMEYQYSPEKLSTYIINRMHYAKRKSKTA